MEPHYRFTLDLIGLAASTLVLLAVLAFLPPLNLRVAMVLFALVAICLAWALSLAHGLTDANVWAIASLASITWAAIFVLAALLAAVLA